MPKILDNESDIVSFVKYLPRGIKKFGIVRIEKKLKELSYDSYDNHQKMLKDKIFNEISDSFGVSKSAIFPFLSV